MDNLNINSKPIELTNEELARMIAEGFANTASKQELAVVQTGIAGLKTDVADLKAEFKEFDGRLSTVGHKIDRALYKEAERIDVLETDMKLVKGKLGLA